MWQAHMDLTYILQVLTKSQWVWLPHVQAEATLLKAQVGPHSTMAWALQELRLHRKPEQQAVPRVALD